MLSNQDHYYINNTLHTIKATMIRLASEYGPTYCSDFLVSFEDIKNHANRQRLTEVTIAEYTALFRGHNIVVDNHPQGLLLRACVDSILLAPNDASSLAQSLQLFRSRAALHGDVDNI